MANTSDLPKIMQAWTHTVAGLPSQVLTLTPDLPIPTPTNTEVLIKISHAALNPGGSIMMQLCPMVFRTRPAIPEMDFAGTIHHVGSEVPPSRGLVAGAHVFGSIPVGAHIGGGKGSLAGYVIVGAENICLNPEKMPLEQAAGLAIAGSTALALLDAAKLKEGHRVLVNGASGGIGSLILQMTKETVGKTGVVVAICSERNVEMVKDLGADEVIDYQKHTSTHAHLAEKFGAEQFDVIIDAVGIQPIFLNSANYLKPGMAYVTVGPTPSSYTYIGMFASVGQMMSNMLWPRILGGVNRSYVQVTGLANLTDLERLAAMAKEGKLKVPVDSLWEMKDVFKAYDTVLSRRARGKVIVNVQTS